MKDNDDLEFDDDDIIDFEEFEVYEKDAKKKEVDAADIEKHLIFQVDNGCPICGADVKGNEHYRFFCEHCNVLFDKKDIIEQEFGGSIADQSKGKVRKMRLSEEESESLSEKRKALKDRIFKTFSEDQKQELLEEAEVEKEEAEEEPVEETPLDDNIYEDADDEEPAEESDPVADRAASLEAELGLINQDDEETEPSVSQDQVLTPNDQSPEEDNEGEEDNETDDDEGEEEPDDDQSPDEDDEDLEEDDSEDDTDDEKPEVIEYDLDDPDKIVASSQSTKMHKGNCHFVKKINPDNRIYVESIEDGEEDGYELCVCLRRLVAKKRAEK